MNWRKVEPAARDAVIVRLREAFPGAFNAERPPLRIGIHTEITERMPDIQADALAAALRWWTGDIEYLAGVVCQHPRVGLDGQPSGEVPQDDHAAAALSAIASRVGRPAEELDARRFHHWSRKAKALAERVAGSGELMTLSGDDLELARRMLVRHEGLASRLADGVAGVEIRPARGRGHARGEFYAFAPSGDAVFFRPLDCVAPKPPRPAPLPPKRKVAAPAAVVPDVVEIEITARAAKIAVPMRGADYVAAVRAARVLEGTQAAIVMKAKDVGVGAKVAAKAILKAARAASQADGHVILQGRLGKRGIVEDAGLGFQPKTSAGG